VEDADVKRRNIIIIGLVAISSAFESASAQGHEPHEVSLGLMGGGSPPIGSLLLGIERPWHAGAIAELRSSFPGVSFRFEASYFSRSTSPAVAIDSIGGVMGEVAAGQRVVGGIANAVFRAPFGTRSIQTYAIVGIGVFGIQTYSEGPGPTGPWRLTLPLEIRPGLNAGLGVETTIRRVTAFAEARYHAVRQAVRTPTLQMVPLSVGFRVR
jgi:hypothetical protein